MVLGIVFFFFCSFTFHILFGLFFFQFSFNFFHCFQLFLFIQSRSHFGFLPKKISRKKTLKVENSGFVKTWDEPIPRCQIARLWFRREWWRNYTDCHGWRSRSNGLHINTKAIKDNNQLANFSGIAILNYFKGQLISKCLFGCHRFAQKTKFFLFRRSNKKVG